MIKYSIILPIYNVEDYLNECLDSILCQKNTNYEIILVDDGSTDNSLNICIQYKNKYKNISVIHKDNCGVSSARNIGIDKAKGEYILFIDPDDYVESNYLDVIDSNLKNNQLLIFGFNKIYKNKIVPGYSLNIKLDSNKALEYLVDDSKFCGFIWNKVFKKSIIDKYNIRFDEDISMCEDLLFSYQYIEHISKVSVIGDKLINYRQRKSSEMSKKILEINPYSLIKTYEYIILNSKNDKIKLKGESLYLKAYYKYKNNRKIINFNSEILDSSKNDYNSFSSKDKKIINMYKYVPFMRKFLYKLRDMRLKKYK